MNANINKKVAYWKNQLLDLSRRNRMIQFRETRLSSLRLQTPDCETLFERIYRKEETLTFSREMDRHQNPRMFSMMKLFSALEAPIEISVGEIRAEGTFSDIQRTLSAMRSKAKLSLEEQGINILFLCIGLLRWSSTKKTYKEEMLSPLLLVPVVLQRETLSSPFTISRYEDDAVINPTLAYLMQSEFDIQLPEYDAEEEPIRNFMTRMAQFAREHGWELLREARLGLMSFQKITMYKDIQNNLERIASNPVMLALAGDASALALPEEELPDLDSIPSSDVYEVMGADSSQQEAILYARRGISFVMQGPPGTGKSQTIANIIAASLADGKKVLFVSEKAAALEVVYKRLCDVKLGDFCLPLHSSKANKREIIDRLGTTLERQHFNVKDSVLSKLEQHDVEREQLNLYAGSLHRKVEPFGMTIYELYTELLHLSDTPEVFFDLPGFEQMKQGDLFRMQQQLRKYDTSARKLQYQVHNHPWTGIKRDHAGMEYTNTMRTHLAALNRQSIEMVPLLVKLDELSVSEEWLCGDTLSRLETLEQFALLRYAPENWFTTGGQEALLETAEYLRATAEMQGQLDASIRQLMREEAFTFDAQNWTAQWKSVKRIFSTLPTELNVEDTYPETAKQCNTLQQAICTIRDHAYTAAKILKCPAPNTMPETEKLFRWLETARQIVQCRKEWLEQKKHAQRMKQVMQLAEYAAEEESLSVRIMEQWQPALLEEPIELVLEHFRNAYAPKRFLNTLKNILHKCSVDTLPDNAQADILTLDETFQALQMQLQTAETATGIPADRLNSDPELYEKAARLLDSNAPLEPIWVNGQTNPERLRSALNEIETLSLRHSNQEQLILENWNTQALTFAYEEILQRYRTEYTSFLKILRPSWHRDRREIRSIRRSTKAVSDEEILQFLTSMEEKHETEADFQKKADKTRSLFGSQYQSFDTSWEEISSGIQLAEKMTELFSSVPAVFAEKAAQNRPALRMALMEAAEKTKELQKKIISLCDALHLDPSLEKTMPYIQKAARCIQETEEAKAADISYISSFLKQPRELREDEIGEVLEHAARCRWLRGELSAAPKELVPPQPDVRWEQVCSALQCIDMLRSEKAPDGLFRWLCQEHSDDDNDVLERCIASVRGELESLQPEPLLPKIRSFTFSRIEAYLGKIQECIGSILSLLAKTDSLTIAKTDHAAIAECMEELSEYQKNRAYFSANNKELRKLFGPMYDGEQTHFDTLCQAAKAAERFRTLGLPEAFFTVTCREESVRIQLAEICTKLHQLYQTAMPHIQWLDAQFNEKSRFSTMLLSEQAERTQQCLVQLDRMHDWLDYCQIRQDCMRSPMKDYIQVIERQEAFDDITASFTKGFYSKLIDYATSQETSLSSFRLSEQEAHIDSFRKLDDFGMQAAQLRILERLIDHLPDSSQLLRVNDETAILRKQMSTKRQMPLRRLFARIPNLLMRLSPCMMMSPLSVSYFLEAQTYQFDVVIFDEASQIRPEDAIGAILRGQQVIIAGDVKQMPPTSFFKASSTTEENEDDEEPEEELADSILEEAACALPGKTLLWHYRSRNEDLITFSNHAIYHGQLVTFPSASDAQDMGVQLVYVADGIYEKNQNLAEAEKCVELLEKHILSHPERSLGIIAFSEKQQEAIQSAVERFRLDHPKYERFFESHPEEPFFIKNLENVQGDERDTILFSICYAKNRQHRMYMRFGPLGQQGGERRLNVAITRAKCNVKLVSSILPEDLRDAKAQGVKLLRDYIYFAQHGSTAQTRTDPHPGEHDDFCDIVAEYLVQHGYQVRRDIGNSSYRIDIGVLCPGKKDAYLAGIECDGDSYRRARTARDRDVLRTSILQHMGWKMHRIWSTEWVRNGQTERMRLLKFLDDAQKQGHSVDLTEPLPEVNAETLIELSAPKTDVLSNYAVYEETPVTSLKPVTTLTDYQAIAYDLQKIIAFEQPIHIENVYRRMQEPMGAVKMAAKYKNAIQMTLSQYLQKEVRMDDEEFLWTIPPEPVVPRRTAGKETLRKAEHIALEEIMELMKQVLLSAIGLTEDDLIAETATILGYEHRGARINNRLQEAVKRMMRSKLLTVMDEKLVWSGGDK